MSLLFCRIVLNITSALLLGSVVSILGFVVVISALGGKTNLLSHVLSGKNGDSGGISFFEMKLHR